MALKQAAALPAGGSIDVATTQIAPAQASSAARATAEATRAALLTAPILSTLLKLALPTVTVLVAQTAVNIAEG